MKEIYFEFWVKPANLAITSQILYNFENRGC